MPLTAEQSYALGTRGGRDRLNQQLRANPHYAAYLRSIGADPNGGLSDQQRQQAQAWVSQNLGGIGGLEIDPAGNLNNPHGFAQELKQWGPVAAAAGGIAAAPFILPALAGAGATAPSVGGLYAATPGAIASQGASLGMALPGATAAASAGGNMGLLGSILKGIDKGSDLLGAFGSGAGAYSQGQAQNRGNQLDAQFLMEKLLMEREQQAFNEQILAERANRESGQDAWRRMIAAQRTLAPTPKPMLSPYAAPPRRATATEREGATAMTDEVMKRLRGGGLITPTPPRDMNVDMDLTQPGMLEKILGIASPVGTYIGNRNRPIYQLHGGAR